jgi:hypothetical protein
MNELDAWSRVRELENELDRTRAMKMSDAHGLTPLQHLQHNLALMPYGQLAVAISDAASELTRRLRLGGGP